MEKNNLMNKFLSELKDFDEEQFIKSILPKAGLVAKGIKETATQAAKEFTKDIETDDKVYISYENITKQMKLAGNILGDDYDTILCITRGGLIPAGMLAYQLGIKDIVNIKISSYNDDDEQEIVEVQPLSKKDIKKLKRSNKVLIVDDILDSGNTLKELDLYLYDALKDNYIEYDVFNIVTKNKELSDYSIYNMTGDDRWVVFPWDK